MHTTPYLVPCIVGLWIALGQTRVQEAELGHAHLAALVLAERGNTAAQHDVPAEVPDRGKVWIAGQQRLRQLKGLTVQLALGALRRRT